MPPRREPSPKRRRLAAALRAERERAGLTTRQLADRIGLSQAWVSQREQGERRVSTANVEAWCAGTRADPERLEELIELAIDADIEAQTWGDVYAAQGAAGAQANYAALDDAATHIAVYQTAVIPGLAQTAEYARRVLALMRVDPAEIPAAAAARIERQSVLYAPGKRVDLLMTEAVLRLRVGPPDVMRAQLDKLTSIATLPAVSLAVVPLDAEVRELPQGPFVLREFSDGTGMVTHETLARQIDTEAVSDVARYLSALKGYLAVAATGEAATALIREAGKHHD